jgi:GT2 family glycosyltransferase
MSGSSPDAGRPRVAVVVPNYNGDRWLPGCLDALAAQTFADREVVLVDNGSTDGSVALVRARHPGVRVIALERNTGFAPAVNLGIRAAGGEYVALLNTDTVARPDWLAALVRALDESPPETGAVASKMLSLDDPGRIDDAGDALAWTGAAEKLGHGEPAHRFTQRSEVFSVCAGAALYRRSFLDAVGGFDERFFAYLEDVDLGLRGRLLGYRYLFEPAAEVLHKGHGSAIPRADYVRLNTRNRVMLFAKSVPGSLLLKHLPRLLYGQLYFAIVYRRPVASLAGYAALVPCLAHIWRERRRARASRRLDPTEIDGLLTTRMREPPLRLILRRQLGRLRP